MLDNLTPEQLVLVVGAITGLIGALTASWVSVTRANAEAAKVRAEVGTILAEMAEDRKVAKQSAQLLRETHHQVIPNNGGSLMDSSTRNEGALADLTANIRRLDDNLLNVAGDVRGLRRDIGRLATADQQLAAADLRDREAADQAHALIHQRLDDLAAGCGD